MIKIVVLGSSSKGNAIYFNVDGHQFLIDCGFTKKETTKRLALIGKEIKDIERVFVTHDHGDHCAPWIVKEGLKVITGSELVVYERLFDTTKIVSFPLSHDGENSVGYVIKDREGHKVAVLNDTGCILEEVIPYLFDCSAIMIETNYDVEMLAVGKYPTDLLERIASDHGHLRNECAAEAVEVVAWPGLQYIVCLHLSASNNHPDLARFCMESLQTGAEVIVAEQQKPSKLMVIL
jgi:phosphoribosyl 1,2-cyclic phosphodiesterase